MKTTKRRITTMLLALMMVLALVPVSAFASSDQIEVTVNIYVNNNIKTTDTVGQIDDDIFELEYGSLPIGYLYGDAYGVYESGNVSINGKRGYFFCFDGENVSIFPANFANLTPEDEIIVNLYYTAEGEEEPVVLGNAEVEIFINGTGTPAEGVNVNFTGKKGADVKTLTATSGADGIAKAEGLDVSYTWTYEIEGVMFGVEFDDDNSFFTQWAVNRQVEEPAVEQPAETEEPENEEPAEKHYYDEEFANETYTITVTHSFKTQAGGTSVDGHVEGATEIAGKTVTLHAGEESFFGGSLFEAANGEFEVIEAVKTSGKVLYNGDSYKFTGSYVSGGNNSPAIGSINDINFGESFRMIRDNITVILHYTLEEPVYTVTMNYTDEDGNVLASQEMNSYRGSTNALGEKSYDVSGFEPGVYAGYKVVEGYTYNRAEGDAVIGELDGNKVINFIFTKDEIPAEPVVTEEPTEEPVVTEEPAEEPVVTEEPAEEPAVTEEPAEEPAVTEEPAEEPAVTEEPAEEPVVTEEPAEEPVVTEEPAEEPKEEQIVPAITTQGQGPTGPQAQPIEDPAAEITEPAEITAPEADQTEIIEAPAEIIEINEVEVPLAEANNSGWALINLLCMAATIITAAGMLITYLRKRDDDEDNQDEEEQARRRASKFFGIIPAVIAVIVFILTENMRNPMVLIDRWTIVMAVILLVNIVMAVVTRNKDNDNDDRQTTEVNAVA